MRLSYPETPRGRDVEVAAGLKFEDPYRWLEGEDSTVKKWQAEQNTLAQQYVKSWRHFAALKESVSHYLTDRIRALPRFAAGKWFRAEQATSTSSPRVVVSRAPFGGGVQLSVAEIGPHPLFLSWVSPSPDGRFVAVGVCSDATENNRIQLIDVARGASLSSSPRQLLMDSWTGGACWLPDSSGFYFLALQGESRAFRQGMFFHNLQSGKQHRIHIPLPDPDSSDYTLISPSSDGRYLIAHHGLFAPKPVAVLDLAEGDPNWRPFVTSPGETVAGFAQGCQFIAMTNVGAPRGRIVAIRLDASNPNDTSQWVELVRESEFVMRSIVQVVGRFIYCAGYVDTYSEIRIFSLKGERVGVVPLPGKGAISEPYFPLMTLVPRSHPDEYHFVYSSFTQSWGAYRHRPGDSEIELLREPRVTIENAIIEDRWATSSDGMSVPYHTVRLSAGRDALPRPALVYAYGAFNFPLVPEYPGAMAAFIAAGGTYVHGHIRGGAELGLEWWRGGRMNKKQNCYEDLYAIAADVVAKGLTSPEMLGLTGRSNGGLLAGVALTQRPNLWRVVVSEVPVTDLVGILRDAYGRYALSREYANPDDPEEVIRLTTFSPYHLVAEHTAYPATYISAGAADPRCPAWHARKFAARLQVANAGSTPVLLRVHESAGHGEANARAVQIDNYTEWLAFVMMQLSMEPKG